MLLRALLLLLLPLRLTLLLALLQLLLALLLLLLALLLALLALLVALVVQRQVDGEAGAHALLALDVHVAVVAVDDLLHHGKANAQAAALARAAGVRAPEAGEHHLRLVGRKADARVAHGDGAHALVAGNADGDGAALGRIAHCIGDEVGRGLADHVRIAAHAHAALHLVDELEARVGHIGLVRGDDAADEVAHLEHFLLHGRAAVFQTGKLQDGVDQAA